MNSRRSLVMAAILFIGAIAAGYWGLVLTRNQPIESVPLSQALEQSVTSAQDQNRKAVVVLTRDVAPHIALTADDLTLEKLRIIPVGSLTSIDQAVGRTPWRALNAGTWLNEQSFEVGGPLARMIRPNERALAVAIDEVIGAAGQFGPGDYVDILLFLRQEGANPQPSAQVILPAARVLSVGDELGLTSDGQPVSLPVAGEQAQQQAQRRVGARTVVLAVPEPLISQLMLATHAGTLRLAVRSAQEQRLSQYWADEEDALSNLQAAQRSLYQFNQLALADPAKAPVSTRSAGAPRVRGIEIIRGAQTAQQPTQ